LDCVKICGDPAYTGYKGMGKAFGWLLNKAMLLKNTEMYFLKLFFCDFLIFSAFDIARNDFVNIEKPVACVQQLV